MCCRWLCFETFVRSCRLQCTTHDARYGKAKGQEKESKKEDELRGADHILLYSTVADNHHASHLKCAFTMLLF